MLVLAFGKLALGCSQKECERLRIAYQLTDKKLPFRCADFLENSCYTWTENCDGVQLTNKFQWLADEIVVKRLGSQCDDHEELRNELSTSQMPLGTRDYPTINQLERMARPQLSDSDSNSIDLGGSRGSSESEVIQTKPKGKKKIVWDDSVESLTESQRNNNDIEILDIDINSGKGKKKPKKPTKKS
jgi:hypothetical protein